MSSVIRSSGGPQRFHRRLNLAQPDDLAEADVTQKDSVAHHESLIQAATVALHLTHDTSHAAHLTDLGRGPLGASSAMSVTCGNCG